MQARARASTGAPIRALFIGLQSRLRRRSPGTPFNGSEQSAVPIRASVTQTLSGAVRVLARANAQAPRAGGGLPTKHGARRAAFAARLWSDDRRRSAAAKAPSARNSGISPHASSPAAARIPPLDRS